MATRKTLSFPIRAQLWSSIDLGEQRFLPIINRMKDDQALLLRLTDRIGRPTAVAAAVSGLTCALDSVAPSVGLAPIAVATGALAFFGLFGAAFVCLHGLRRLASDDERR